MKLMFLETMLCVVVTNVCVLTVSKTNDLPNSISSLFKTNKLKNGSNLCFDEAPTSVHWLPAKNAAVRCGVRCANVLTTSSSNQACYGYNVHAMTGRCDIYQFVPRQSSVVNGCAAFFIPPANCKIDVLAYNSLPMCPSPTPMIGYVTLNQQRVWYGDACDFSANPRGVSVLSIDPFYCIAHSITTYDTFLSDTDAQALSDFIQSAAIGTILVAVTADEAASRLSPAYDALASLGADVTSVPYRGNFAFIAQVGYKWKTQFQMVPQSQTLIQSCIKALLTGPTVENLIFQSFGCY